MPGGGSQPRGLCHGLPEHRPSVPGQPNPRCVCAGHGKKKKKKFSYKMSGVSVEVDTYCYLWESLKAKVILKNSFLFSLCSSYLCIEFEMTLLE